MEKSKKTLILSMLGIISLVLITIGVTYAFFNYAKEGTTENSITTGTITFIYEEVELQGAGISISDAYPMSDEVGKAQTGSGNVFNFKVKSQTIDSAAIPYTVTARMKSDSTLDQNAVKLYLTEVEGDTETEILLDIYDNLTQTSVEVPDGVVEKVIYIDTVPAGSSSYEKNFRLRIWIPDTIDFSPEEDEDGNIIYPYNGKTFTVTVNVYANAKVVTDEEVAYSRNTEISTLSVGGTELTAVEGQDYDYATELPTGTTSTTIEVETVNPNATVEIEKVDSLAYSSNIKRLSVSKEFELVSGDNYFQVTVTSENKQVIDSYIIKVKRNDKVVVYDSAISYWTYSTTLWTNNTGSTKTVYCTVKCTDGDYDTGSYVQIGLNSNYTIKATGIGNSKSGTISVPNGSSITYNSYYADGYVTLYYQ